MELTDHKDCAANSREQLLLPATSFIHPHNLNDTHLNSVPSDPLEIGPELTMNYPLETFLIRRIARE